MMSIIKDLKTDKNGWFADGKFNSISLFKGEMAVSIFVDDGATVEYAEKCITHYNNLNNNSNMLLKLQEYLIKFFLYMYAEWKEMGIYDEIVDDIEHELISREFEYFPDRRDAPGHFQCLRIFLIRYDK